MSDDTCLSPTMRQIAERAGVNRSTVSLALRNDPRLKATTRQKIQALAAEMGYRHNPTVAKLMTQLRAGQQKHFQSNIAVINFGPPVAVKAVIWESALKRAKMLGYGLELFRVQDMLPHRLEQILVSRGIRGILLYSLWGTPRLPDEFLQMWDRFASCSMGIQTSNPQLHFVSDDNFYTSITATEKLAKLGFSKIGLAMQESIDTETAHRFVGGYLAAREMNPQVKGLPVLMIAKTDREKFLSWYRRVKPDVILCIQEEILTWLIEAGYEVPRDVSLVHLDLEATTSRKWAGMHQDRASRGAFAIELIIAQINRNEMGPPSSQVAMLTESRWEDGDTLAIPNQSVRESATLPAAPRRARDSKLKAVA